jgi:hypothetical protein
VLLAGADVAMMTSALLRHGPDPAASERANYIRTLASHPAPRR